MTPSLKRDTWQQHIQAWQQSQLSKKAYCREHNLNSACFYKWYSKLALKPAAPQPALASAMNSLTLIPLTRPKTLHLVTHLSLHSPKGWRIDLEPVDMRLGIDGLSSRVVQYLGKSPCDGHAYAFTNRSRNRLKLVVWDGNGVWLCQRRLHQGHFVWPQSIESSYEVSEAQWQWLVNGIDWRRLNRPLPTDWQVG
jgi:transposase